MLTRDDPSPASAAYQAYLTNAFDSIAEELVAAAGGWPDDPRKREWLASVVQQRWTDWRMAADWGNAPAGKGSWFERWWDAQA